MSDLDNSGCMVFIFILTTIVSILSGVLAWDLMNPKNFLGAIGFLILWGVLSYIGHMILTFIAMIFMDKKP